MWTDFFTSRYVKSLEKSLENSTVETTSLILRHQKELGELACLYELRIADLKSAHAEAWKHVIEDNQRLQDLCERYRVALNPTIAKASTEAPPAMPDEDTGTPWQRVLRKALKEQQEAASKVYIKPADSPVPVTENQVATKDA